MGNCRRVFRWDCAGGIQGRSALPSKGLSSTALRNALRGVLLVTLTSHLGLRDASAQSGLEVDLVYLVEPELRDCPTEASFRELVQEQLGYDPFRSAAAYRISARARLHEGAALGVVHWEYSSSDVGGERELRGRSCQDLVRAMSFAVAVQIQLFMEQVNDVDLVGPQKSTTDVPSVDTNSPWTPATADTTRALPATPKQPPSTPVEVKDKPRSVEIQDGDESSSMTSWRVAVGAGGGLRLRATPLATPEGRVFAVVGRRVLNAELGVGGAWPFQWEAGDGSGFRLWSAWGSAAVCTGPFSVGACLGGRLERLFARGTGVDVPKSAAAWVVEVGPRLALNTELSRELQATLYLEARGVIAPARVILDGSRVWQSTPWVVTVGVDVTVLASSAD